MKHGDSVDPSTATLPSLFLLLGTRLLEALQRFQLRLIFSRWEMHGRILLLVHEFGISGLLILYFGGRYARNDFRFHHGGVDHFSLGGCMQLVGVLSGNLTTFLRLYATFGYHGRIESAFTVVLISTEKVLAHLHFSNCRRLIFLLLIFLL